MAQLRRTTIRDQATIDRHLVIARLFLRIALDPPVDPGHDRETAIRERDETLEACDVDGLRRIAREHRRHRGAQHALGVLDRINNRRR
jgi:hypothetical protein